jgi:hypothetical protein
MLDDPEHPEYDLRRGDLLSGEEQTRAYMVARERATARNSSCLGEIEFKLGRREPAANRGYPPALLCQGGPNLLRVIETDADDPTARYSHGLVVAGENADEAAQLWESVKLSVQKQVDIGGRYAWERLLFSQVKANRSTDEAERREAKKLLAMGLLGNAAIVSDRTLAGILVKETLLGPHVGRVPWNLVKQFVLLLLTGDEKKVAKGVLLMVLGWMQPNDVEWFEQDVRPMLVDNFDDGESLWTVALQKVTRK